MDLLFLVFTSIVPNNFLSTEALAHSAIFARPTVINPTSQRRIDVGGPTYHRFMKEGAWVNCHDTLRRLDLDALNMYQQGPSKQPCDFAYFQQESEDLKWNVVTPNMVVHGSTSKSTLRSEVPPDALEALHNDLVFVNKPSGMHCVPPRDLSDSLSAQISSVFPGSKPCHRLDRDTSGLVVFGRTVDSHREISTQFEARTVWKQYSALVSGHPRQEAGVISEPIGKVKTVAGFHQWALGGEKMREAITAWRVEERFVVDGAKFSRLLLEPKTGRGHQLRLHLKSIGHPILGDTLHGEGGCACCSPRLCLHALKLQLDWNGLRLEAASISPF